MQKLTDQQRADVLGHVAALLTHPAVEVSISKDAVEVEPTEGVRAFIPGSVTVTVRAPGG